jgi:hypothetical protein
VQARCRAWIAQARYQNFLHKLAKAQATIRRFIQLRRFR